MSFYGGVALGPLKSIFTLPWKALARNLARFMTFLEASGMSFPDASKQAFSFFVSRQKVKEFSVLLLLSLKDSF
jgi:hypothetical protein